ncbi:hypothetical protein B9Z55_027960 [Caenorhabditis nigoni]|uniref:Uncharacterized protein n=1 Tax=Caenorhabditis nigoni TaxID=1611254 RepID=A0A2G5SDI4_9PELO|nr:hypothetical protein B9Z55_027960 [Caenorhabditis nigoni]
MQTEQAAVEARRRHGSTEPSGDWYTDRPHRKRREWKKWQEQDPASEGTPRPTSANDPRSNKAYALDCEMVYSRWTRAGSFDYGRHV